MRKLDALYEDLLRAGFFFTYDGGGADGWTCAILSKHDAVPLPLCEAVGNSKGQAKRAVLIRWLREQQRKKDEADAPKTDAPH